METQKGRSKYNVQRCRVCLTQVLPSKENSHLEKPLYDGDKDSPLIFEALEEIMGEQIIKFEECSNICFRCQRRLKSAYDLKRKYYESKQSLLNKVLKLVDSGYYKSQRVSIRNKIVGCTQYKMDSMEEGRKAKNEPNVELILGKNSFDIKELVILEDTHDEEDNKIYQGFLNNLGSQVSASFVKNNKRLQTIKNIQPEFVMVKVEEDGDSNIESDDNLPLSEIKEKATGAPLKPLSCEQCYRLFKSADFLKTHQVVCEKFKKLECYICQEKKINSTVLLRHLANIHGVGKSLTFKTRRVERTPKQTKCQICSKVLCSTSGLNRHMRHCHRGEKYPCEYCGKIFRSTHGRNMHISFKHKRVTKDLCPFCAKTFHYKGGLKQHMMYAHEKRTTKEMCPVCARTYYYKGALKCHMQTHTKDYRYKCQYCDNKFGTVASKKRHEMTHTGEKPFACSYEGCTFAFTTGYARTLHEQVRHRGTRAHKCDACAREFGRRYKLMIHMLSHQGPFICKFCELGCFNQNVLNYHLKYKHKIQIENEPMAKEGEENLENNKDSIVNYDSPNEVISHFLSS